MFTVTDGSSLHIRFVPSGIFLYPSSGCSWVFPMFSLAQELDSFAPCDIAEVSLDITRFVNIVHYLEFLKKEHSLH
jgi:hypothetical protein